MNRKVLLIEPNYKNKYPPMGLMKLATYYRNCGDDVRFFKGELKQFAAQLLAEEFYAEYKRFDFGRGFQKIIEFIWKGKSDILENQPWFQEDNIRERLRYYHKRYIRLDYPKFDIVGITTLFTFYWAKTIDTIKEAKNFCTSEGRIIVGGIASTLNPDELYKETGIKPHVGLLDKPGALDEGNTDIIDELPLDYSILEEIEYTYPTNNAYFAYMTRGCIRRCQFCAVSTLEPTYKNYIGIADQLAYIDEKFGNRKDLMLMDNNVFASDKYNQIIDEIKACGFAKGATYVPSNEYEVALKNIKTNYNVRAYTRKMIRLYDTISDRLPEEKQGDFYIAREERGLLYPITATKEAIIAFDDIFGPLYSSIVNVGKRARYIDFNQGLDARLAVNDENYLKRMAEISIRPLRIAFDHYEQKDIYIKAIKQAAKVGIREMSNYLLYNFQDEPDDLYYRMRINVDLCEELDVMIYSFPMKYHPIQDPDYFRNRDYIGKHWNRKFIRAIQAVLNSTKGKIGRGVEFFEEAFGRNIDDFNRILWMPETFIIYRRQYDANLRSRLADKYKSVSSLDCDLANEWWEKFKSLPEDKLETAKEIISKNRFCDGDYECSDPDILDVLKYYSISRGDAEQRNDIL